MPAFEVSGEEWQAAKKHFESIQNQAAVKLRKKDDPEYPQEKGKRDPEKHSFVYIGRKLLAMANGDYLGEGGFGKVKIAIDEEGNEYAIKIEGIEKSNEEMTEVAKQDEFQTMQKTGYLMEYRTRTLAESTVFMKKEISGKIYTVMALRKGNSLGHRISELEQPLSAKQFLMVMLQSMEQIQNLHQHHIIHRDIKPENFMCNVPLTDSDNLKIHAIDFGGAIDLESRRARKNVSEFHGVLQYNEPRNIIFTADYVAPEICKADPVTKVFSGQGIYSIPSDVFALGKMIQELFDKVSPAARKELFELVELCKSMLREDPHKRPKLGEVIKLFQSKLKEINKEEQAQGRSVSFKHYLREAYPKIAKGLQEDFGEDYDLNKALLYVLRNSENFYIVKTLLEKEPDLDVNKKDEEGVTALWVAVKEENLEAAKLLLEGSADPNISVETRRGKVTLFELAALTKNQPMINLLKKYNEEAQRKPLVDRVKEREKELEQSEVKSRESKAREASAILQFSPEPASANFSKQPAVTSFQEYLTDFPEATEKLQELLRAGDLTMVLHYLVFNDKSDDLIQALLEREKVDINRKNEDGMSVLWHAVREDRENLVDLLLKYGADPDVTMEGRDKQPISLERLTKHRDNQAIIDRLEKAKQAKGSPRL